MALKPPIVHARSEINAAFAVAAAVLLYVIATLVSGSYGYAFFSIPIFVGFIAGALDPRRATRAAFIALGISSLLALVSLREGVVCLVLSLPVTVPLLLVGAWTGSVLISHYRTRRAQRNSIVLMLLIGAGAQFVEAALDDPRQHPLHRAQTSIELEASAERVFALLTAPELRVANRWPWFLRIGLPMPSRMLVERSGPSGRLRFEYAQMTVGAHVTRWDPGRELSYQVDHYEIHDLPFHITRLGRGPDYGLRRERVHDWMTILDTSYLFTPTERGCRLTRKMRWRRHLRPDLYFGWLQQTVIERGQDRLLELIAERLHETTPAPAHDPQPLAQKR